MNLFFEIIIFIVSLLVLVKAADIFAENSEKLGIAFGIPPFIIGLTIVTLGTTLPELSTSLIAVFKGTTEIIAANAVGSIVVNILLIVGLSALLAKVLIVKKDLVDVYIPFLIGSLIILIFVVLDGKVVFAESLVLMLGYFVYLSYIFSHKKKISEDIKRTKEIIKGNKNKKKRSFFAGIREVAEKIIGFKKDAELIAWQNVLLIVLGAFFVYLSAKYSIDSLISIASILKINTTIIAMSALALGTSLPELVVSLTSVLKGREEIGISNIIGSSIVNSFLIIGFPGIFSTLIVDQKTLLVGIPFGVGAVLFFLFSGMDRKIYNWEGLVYLFIFALFIAKLFGIF